MIYELRPEYYARVAPLYPDTWERSSIEAVLSGRRTDRCFVLADDPIKPASALVAHVGNYMLAGEPTEPMIQFILDAPGESRAFAAGYYAYYAISEGWEAVLSRIAHADTIITQRKTFRHEYQPVRALPDWRGMLPKGAEIRPMDAALAEQVDRELEGQLIGMLWTEDNDGDWDRYPSSGYATFAQRSFGVAMLMHGQVVCTYWAFHISDSAASVEVETAERFRRRGLATITGWAWLEACQQRRLASEWIADADNQASLKLALRLGHSPLRDVKKFVWKTWDQDIVLNYGGWTREPHPVGWKWSKVRTP